MTEEVVQESSNIDGTRKDKVPDWQEYINESTIVPSNIKNLSGINLVVDLISEEQEDHMEAALLRRETQ